MAKSKSEARRILAEENALGKCMIKDSPKLIRAMYIDSDFDPLWARHAGPEFSYFQKKKYFE